MGLKAALAAYKDLICNEEASKKARETHALKIRTLQLLRKEGVQSHHFEYRVVKEHRYTLSTEYLCKSIITHLPRYKAVDIIDACLQIAPVLTAGETVITAEQIDISRTMYLLRRDLDRGNPMPIEQYEELVQYTLTHPDDWNVLKPIIFDRGIETLQEMLAVRAVMNEAGSTAITEGSL